MDSFFLNSLNLAQIAGFLPLIYALYLLVSRIRLSYINKKVLNYGALTVSFLSLVLFIVSYFLFKEPSGITFEYLLTNRLMFDFGFMLDETNLLFLIFSSFLYFLTAVYSKLFFESEKQFIFTKQRYCFFTSIAAFSVYMFLLSSNLFQALIFSFALGVIIFIFSYFDIFKHPVNYNINRFSRISLFGNTCFLLFILILFKYSITSDGYISSIALSYDELNSLFGYMYGISSGFEFKLMLLAFLGIIASFLALFPFGCYYSFFANSSNILYLSTAISAFNIFAIYLLVKMLQSCEFIKEYSLCISAFLLFGIVAAVIFLLFERNIKIFSGYLISIINSIFVILFFNFEFSFIYYFLFAVLFNLVLMKLFSRNKISFKKSIITKQKGFILERVHIAFFEVFPLKLFALLNFIDEKISANIPVLIFSGGNFFVSLFAKKTIKISRVKVINRVLLMFIFFVLFALFVALFGGFES